ncbi:MAG: hypothetical protein KGJ77_10280 [Acidobacteriota bacterium]|nr:hypothetical protein [Acidobacteriota bacterium]
MLGLVVVALGGLFILMGANGLVSAGQDRPRRSLPGSEWGPRPASPASRRLAGGAWVLLGLFFVIAAFTHLPPL